MAPSQSIRKAIFGVTGIVLISKLFGFIREMVIAERFGTSFEYDVFLIAIAGPVFFNLVVMHSTNYFAVPYLTKKIMVPADRADWRDIWSVFNTLVAIVLMIVAFIFLLAPYLVGIFGRNLEAESFERAVFYCRGASVLVLLGFLESFLRSGLNVLKRFVYPALGTIVLNIVIISIIYSLSAELSVTALLVGLIVGTSVQVIFLSLRLFNVRFLKCFNLRIFGHEMKNILAVGGAIVMVELLSRTYFLIDRYFAAGMMEGVVSALNYCSLLVMFPISIIGFSIASVTFPYLSERAGNDTAGEFVSLLKSALRLSLAIGLPCGIFYMAFAEDIIGAVFFRGAFDLSSLEITSNILITLGPYMVCLFLYTILLQACYSLGHQKSVVLVAVSGVVLKFILTAVFKNIFDYPGIGMASSVVYVVSAGMLIFILRRDGRIENLRWFFSAAGKVIVASIPMLIIAYFYSRLPDFEDGMSLLARIRVIWAAGPSLLLFVLIGYIIKVDEIRSFWGGRGQSPGGSQA